MRRIGLGLLVCAVLAGCGHGRVEKGASGAAIGAGVGAVGADYLGRDPLLGAVLGGLGGAALGVRLGRDDRRYRGRKHRRHKHRRDWDDD